MCPNISTQDSQSYGCETFIYTRRTFIRFRLCLLSLHLIGKLTGYQRDRMRRSISHVHKISHQRVRDRKQYRRRDYYAAHVHPALRSSVCCTGQRHSQLRLNSYCNSLSTKCANRCQTSFRLYKQTIKINASKHTEYSNDRVH